MYNQEQKQEFIKVSVNTDAGRAYGTLFKKTGAYEEELGKDVSNFTASEIKNLYCSFYSTSVETLLVYNTNLSIYTRFMIANGQVKDSQNHFDEIDNKVLLDCVNLTYIHRRILTREQLLADIKKLPNACQKWVVLGSFEGLNIEDLCGAKISNIDKEGYLTYSDRRLLLSRELLEIAKESSEQEVYRQSATHEIALKPGDDHIFRLRMKMEDKPNDRSAYSRVWIEMKRVGAITGHPIYYKTKALQESGRIDMIKNLWDHESDLYTTILSNQKEIVYRYGSFKSSNVTRYVTEYGDFIKSL